MSRQEPLALIPEHIDCATLVDLFLTGPDPFRTSASQNKVNKMTVSLLWFLKHTQNRGDLEFVYDSPDAAGCAIFQRDPDTKEKIK